MAPAGDSDTGPNGLQNFPDISSAAVSGPQATIDYSIDTNAGTYTVEFFTSTTADASGYGEGARYLGTDTITVSVCGPKSGSVTLTPSTPVQPGDAITATATDATGNTSEFSGYRGATVACATGSLTGSRAAPAASPVDLTAAGTLDWAVWGFANGGTSNLLAPDVRRAGGTAISALTDVNSPSPIPLRGMGQFGPQPFVFSWSNGSAPTSAASSVQTGIQHNGGPPLMVSTLGTGFQFTVPADLTPRTLRVWVALNRASGQLSATLSDNSAPAYSNSYDVGVGDFIGAVYTVDYTAASPGQTLTVRWIEDGDSCADFRCDNASLHAVALSGAGGGSDPPPLATVALDTTQTSVLSTGRVPLANIPGSAFVARPAGATESTPIKDIPIKDIPIKDIPIKDIPIKDIPIKDIGFGDAAVLPLLGQFPLSEVPLLRTGGWPTALQGTAFASAPLQNVSLGDALGLQAVQALNITFADLDLTRTPLGGLPAIATVLGTVPLGSLPGIDWCLLCRAACFVLGLEPTSGRIERPVGLDPGRPDRGHPDHRDSDQGHSDQGHPDQGHSDQGHSDQGHSDQGHRAERDPDQGHRRYTTLVDCDARQLPQRHALRRVCRRSVGVPGDPSDDRRTSCSRSRAERRDASRPARAALLGHWDDRLGAAQPCDRRAPDRRGRRQQDRRARHGAAAAQPRPERRSGKRHRGRDPARWFRVGSEPHAYRDADRALCGPTRRARGSDRCHGHPRPNNARMDDVRCRRPDVPPRLPGAARAPARPAGVDGVRHAGRRRGGNLGAGDCHGHRPVPLERDARLQPTQ